MSFEPVEDEVLMQSEPASAPVLLVFACWQVAADNARISGFHLTTSKFTPFRASLKMIFGRKLLFICAKAN